jgi:RimJ/RimL family protein N-acetyltransferase
MTRLILDDSERVGAWVAEKTDQSVAWGDFYAMGAEDNDEVIAGIVINNFNGANATCHIAIARPGKYMLALFTLFCQYAFLHAGLLRITGMVPTDMPKVLAFDKNLGFEEEFVMKQAAPGGVDMHVLVMWRDKCRWLKG